MSMQRTAPLSGVLGLLLVVAGLATDRAPDSDWGDAQTQAWFATHGMGGWLVSAVLIALGGAVLLVFAAVLTARQEQVGAGPVTRHLTLLAGGAWALLTIMGGAGFGTIPLAHIFMNPAPPSTATYHVLGGLFYGLLVAFCALAASLLAVTLSVSALRTGLLPRWLAVAGLPAAVLMLANALLPMMLITLYFLTVSIVLTKRGVPQAATTGPMLPAQAVSAPA
jgi:hypothetical protein